MNKKPLWAGLLCLTLASCQETALLTGLKDEVSGRLPWVKTYGTTASDSASDSWGASGGTSLVSGTTGGDGFLASLSASGALLWAKTYGGTSGETIEHAAPTGDGGVIFAGSTQSFGTAASDYDIWVTKTDASGAVRWSYRYGSSASNHVHGVVPLADSTFLVTGYTSVSGTSAAWFLHLTAAGSVATSTYGTYTDVGSSYWKRDDNANATLWGAILGSSGNYVAVGSTGFPYAGLLLSVPFNGFQSASVVAKSYLPTALSGGDFLAVAQASDGGFFAVGDAYSSSPSVPYLWIVKLTSNGDVQWSKTLAGGGTNGQFNGVTATPDGGCLAVGYVVPAGGPGGSDAVAVKFSSTGGVQWQRTYGGPGIDSASAVRTTSTGYLIVGSTASVGAGGNDAWVLSLDASGQPQATSGALVLGRDAGLPVADAAVTATALAGSWSAFSQNPASTLSSLTVADWKPTLATQYSGL